MKKQGGLAEEGDKAAWLAFFQRVPAVATAILFIATIFMDGNVQYLLPLQGTQASPCEVPQFRVGFS